MTIESFSASASDPAASRRQLDTVGFQSGYTRSWHNAVLHQAISVGVGEYRSALGAFSHKAALLNAWNAQGRERFDVLGMPGAFGSHRVVTAPGKYPESSFSVVFRVDRWEFSVAASSAVGPNGAVAATPDLARKLTTAQIDAILPVLGSFFPATPDGAGLRLHDAICHCSIVVPRAWEAVPLDLATINSGLDLALGLPSADMSTPMTMTSTPNIAGILGKAVVVGAAAPDSKSGVFLLRFPTRAVSASTFAKTIVDLKTDNVSISRTAKRHVRLPAGDATEYDLAVSVGQLRGVAESIVVLERAGWTYLLEVVAIAPATDASTLDAVKHSLRFDNR